MNKRKRLLIIVLLFFTIGFTAHGQTISRGEQWSYLGPSLAVPVSESLLEAVPVFFPQTRGPLPYVANSIQILTVVPLYWLDARRAALYSAVELALPAAGLGLMFSGIQDDVAPFLAQQLLFDYNRLTKFTVYEVYRNTRPRVADTAYSADFHPYGFWDLAGAPFMPAVISEPLVWAPGLLMPAVLLAWNALTAPELSPVWVTGETYLGNTRLHPAVWALTALTSSVSSMLINAIGEEALYRGVIYEEIRTAASPGVAKIFDMLFFPLIHVAGDLTSGIEAKSILFNFGWRSLMTLLFDLVYDRGGLPYATALHFYSNEILEIGRWLLLGGKAGS